MSKIGHLQNCLEDIFDEFTLQFLNEMHWIQLEYRVKKQRRILVFTHVFRTNADNARSRLVFTKKLPCQK